MIPSPAEIARIADGLTKAQRALLREERPHCYAGYRPGIKLVELGLVRRGKGGIGDLVEHTPLGLAVRDHLEQSDAC